MRVKLDREKLKSNYYSNEKEFDKKLQVWFMSLSEEQRHNFTLAFKRKNVFILFSLINKLYSLKSLSLKLNAKLKNSIILMFINEIENAVSAITGNNTIFVSSALSYLCVDSLIFDEETDRHHINAYHFIVGTYIDTVTFTEEYLSSNFKFDDLFLDCAINTVQFPLSYEDKIDDIAILKSEHNNVTRVEFK